MCWAHGVTTLSLSEQRQRFARQPTNAPLGNDGRTQRAIKRDGRFIPVEHRPFAPPASPIDRNAGHFADERSTVALAAMLGKDEQVLQMETRPAKKRRVRVEEKRKAHDHSIVLANERFGIGARAEKVRAKLFLCAHDFVLEPLVAGKLANERMQGGHVCCASKANHRWPK